MAIDLRGKSKSVGQYIPDSITPYSIVPIGTTGTLLNLSASPGKRVRLDLLTVRESTETGITIIKDGLTVLSGGSLRAVASSSNTFSVAQAAYNPYVVTSLTQSVLTCMLTDIIGAEIQVVKDSGSTVNEISFAWSEGE